MSKKAMSNILGF